MEGCDKPTGQSGTARGLCSTHYRRWQTYGSEFHVPKRVKAYPKGMTCQREDCDKPVHTKGWCSTHYAAWRRRNNPEAQKVRNREWAERQRALKDSLATRPRPDACELCGRTDLRIVWDHCHDSGTWRGWLCDHCNVALGMVDDNPELLRLMADYVEAHHESRTAQEIAEVEVRSARIA